MVSTIMRQILAPAFVFFVGFTAIAQSQAIANPEESTSSATIRVGASIMNLKYSEVLPSPAKSDEIGNLPGIFFKLELPKTSLFRGAGFASIHSGDETYDGSIMYEDENGKTWIEPYKSKSNSTFYQIGASAGIGFFPSESAELEFTTGLTYNYWARDVAKSYIENYQWWYLPLRTSFTFHANELLSFRASGEFRVMFAASMDLPSKYLEFDIDEKESYNVGLEVLFAITESSKFFINTAIDGYKFGKSPAIGRRDGNVIRYYYEPSSATNNILLGAGVEFLF